MTNTGTINDVIKLYNISTKIKVIWISQFSTIFTPASVLYKQYLYLSQLLYRLNKLKSFCLEWLQNNIFY